MCIAISIINFTTLTAYLLLGSACALSMEELVDEALLTGDWSQVEKKEDAASRRLARQQPVMCEGEYVGYCKASGRLSKRVCTCESYSDVKDALQ
jgi:hypothetical protein